MSRAAVHDAPRLPGFRRGVAASAVALLTAGTVGVAVPAAHAAGSSVPASQALVVLLHDHVVQSWPDTHARRIELVSARRPLTGVPTVLPVLGRATSRGGKAWVHVRLPGRPNSHTGWIAARQTRPASTDWRLSIKLSARLLVVFHDGRVDRRFPAVVGKPSTPTPTGRFFVEEALALSFQVGGPYALATSARSNVLQQFEGGPGQIGIHGTNDLSGALGTAASHGCIRLGTGAITWLAGRIGSGTPLTILR
jgi:lipoprotein-anchoring transpeptidase ErfK/SrfK